MPEGRIVTRRRVLMGAGALALVPASTAAYGIGVEPQLLNVTRYRIAPEGWRRGPRLRVALLSDLHACEPWIGPERIRQIVAVTNALAPDLILCLGDYVRGSLRWARDVPPDVWAPILAGLRAPLGVHAILGNHDWWSDHSLPRARLGDMPEAGRALERAGIPVYQNRAVRLEWRGRPFWLAGLGDQLAQVHRGGRDTLTGRWTGADDLPATLAQIPLGAPAILMAHEPDIFVHVPSRVALTVSGHTHGGQIRFLGYAPVIPSDYGERFAYGHIREQTDLVVTGGLGCSGVPMRLGMPPEIAMVELTGEGEA